MRHLMKSLLVLAALAALASPVEAAIAVANTADGFNSGSVGTLDSAATISTTTGNCIYVLAWAQSGPINSVTDTAGDTFTQTADSPYSAPSTNNQYHWLACSITGNASNTITLHCTGNNCTFIGFTAYEISGLAASPYATAATPTTGNSGTASTAAVSPTNSTGIVFGQVISQFGGGGLTAGSTWTGHAITGATTYLLTEYKTVSGSITPTATLTSANWEMTAPVLNGPAAGGSSSFGGMLLGTGVGH